MGIGNSLDRSSNGVDSALAEAALLCGLTGHEIQPIMWVADDHVARRCGFCLRVIERVERERCGVSS